MWQRVRHRSPHFHHIVSQCHHSPGQCYDSFHCSKELSFPRGNSPQFCESDEFPLSSDFTSENRSTKSLPDLSQSSSSFDQFCRMSPNRTKFDHCASIECSYCYEIFPTRRSLKFHAAVHDGEFVFKNVFES